MSYPPFSLSQPAAYQSQSDDSILQFSPGGNNGGSLSSSNNDGSFSWRGSQMDKLGTYELLPTQDTYHLELTYNYAREATYLVTVLQQEQNILLRFRLTDSHGRITEFTRI